MIKIKLIKNNLMNNKKMNKIIIINLLNKDN